MGRRSRYATSFSLVAFDLDGLKLINDSFGHKAGDRALLAVAESISKNVRAGDIAARVGGDEFVVILGGRHRRKCPRPADRRGAGETAWSMALSTVSLHWRYRCQSGKRGAKRGSSCCGRHRALPSEDSRRRSGRRCPIQLPRHGKTPSSQFPHAPGLLGVDRGQGASK